MFGENWCDISDDLGLDGMPELPPILEPAFSAPVSPEKSATRESEDTSAAGSAIDDNQDDSPKAETRSFASRSRFRFEDFKSTPSQSKTCFIGQMPPESDIEDFRAFVELKGVSVTEIRLGPRKKTTSTRFGYVDLVSDADFHKLIAEDGTMYQGRKIRIDQATPHKKNHSRGPAVTHSRKSAHHFGARKGLRGRADLRRINSAPMPRPGRSNRFLNMNRGKAGTRNFNKRTPKVQRRRQTRSENFRNNSTTNNNHSNWRFNEGGLSSSNPRRQMRN